MTRIIILLGTFFILLASCEKRHWPEGDGTATALKNGEKWDAVSWVKYKTVGSYSEDTIEIFFDTYSKEGFLRDGLSFFAIPFDVGIAKLTEYNFDKTKTITSASFSRSYDDGHVSGDVYDVIEGDPINHFEITEIQHKKDKIKIKGIFSVAMLVDGVKQDPDMPNELRFTDGEFTVYLED